jgi:hypothetical protein
MQTITTRLRALGSGLGLALVLGLAGNAHAQISEAQAEQLMKLSGQWEQLALAATQMREGLLQGLAAGPKPASAEVQQKVQQAAGPAFEAERLRGAARRAVAENTRLNQLPELMRWYESPIARGITQAEVDDTARAEADIQARTKRGMALVQAATPQRQQLLLRLVEASRAASASADIVIQMGAMLPLALMRFDPQARQLPEAELRATLQEQRPQLVQAFEAISLAGFAIAYQALPDEALAAYGNFLAGAAGQHYGDVAEKSFEAAISAAIGALRP